MEKKKPNIHDKFNIHEYDTDGWTKPGNNVLDLDEKELKQRIIRDIKGITQKQAHSILKIIKVENKDKKIQTKYQFLQEARRVHQNKLHIGAPTCTYCFKTFHSRNQMIEHVAVIHKGDEKKFVCGDCPRTFMSSKTLEYHKQRIHSETNEKVKCKMCDALFTHQISLLRHEKIHEEIKPKIECKLCHKTFGRKDSVTKHAKSVHGFLFSMSSFNMVKDLNEKKKMLQCKMCQKEFWGVNAVDELETHITRRCQDFECANCEKYFSSKDNMKQHMSAHHSDQTGFSCTKCDYKSKYKSNLKKHDKRQHPE